MDAQTLVILFLLFSIISSLISKFQERSRKEPDESKLAPKSQAPPSAQRRSDPFEEDEVDWSEWEVLMKPQQPEPLKPEPEAEQSEFQEVKGKRSVSEDDTGPEFQEVSGKRSVSEADTGPEFQAVSGKRSVSEDDTGPEFRRTGTYGAIARNEVGSGKKLKQSVYGRPRRKRKPLLRFTPRTARQAILYSEILGPPRAENMP